MTAIVSVKETKQIIDKTNFRTITRTGRNLRVSTAVFCDRSNVIVVPCFDQLSDAEQDECVRILKNNRLSVTYNYGDDDNDKNSDSYVSENLKHILQLPNDGIESDYLKYMMIASVGKMRFLSRRNIDLLFSLRKFIYNFYNEDHGNTTRNIPELHMLFSFAGKLGSALYDNNAETRYYIFLTFHRWMASKDNNTLRTTITEQEELKESAEELELFSNPEFSLILLIEEIINGISSLENPWKCFHEGRSLDGKSYTLPSRKYIDTNHNDLFAQLYGLLDCGAIELFAYQSLVDWRKVRALPLTLQDFLDKYFSKNEISYISFDDYKNIVYKVSKIPRFSYNPIYTPKRHYIYCLLNDEDKFIDLLMNTTLLQASIDDILLLDFLKEFRDDKTGVPVSLLLSLYGLGDYFND